MRGDRTGKAPDNAHTLSRRLTERIGSTDGAVLFTNLAACNALHSNADKDLEIKDCLNTPSTIYDAGGAFS